MNPDAPPRQAPGRELRFTRARQALPAALIGAVLAGFGLILGVNLVLVHGGEVWLVSGSAAGALASLLLGASLLHHARHCLRHPLLIVSPVGIEIFPLWRPEAHFRLLAWGEIAGMRLSSRALRVDLRGGGGVVLSLRPLWPEQQKLLARALAGRAEELGLGWQAGLEWILEPNPRSIPQPRAKENAPDQDEPVPERSNPPM